MPFNTSGVFQRLFNWANDRDNGIAILAGRMDQEMDGIVQALNDILQGNAGFLAPVKTVNGTAANPSFSFSESTGTGFYRKSDGSVGLSVDGTEVGSFPASFFTEIANHHNATDNPHSVTATQVGALPSTSYTANDILTKLLTVDGADSGLDADTLDGSHKSDFVQATSYTAANILAKLLTVDGANSGLDADTLDGSYKSDFVQVTRKIETDDGLTGGDDLDEDVTIGVDYASQTEAEEATDNTKLLTPLRAKQMLQANSTTVKSLPDTGFMYGAYHSGGVVMSDETLRVWGDCSYAQLGQGSGYLYNRSSPIVPAFPKTTETVTKWLRTGHENVCLMSDGSVYVWGRNGYGCLGVGNTAIVYTPTKVTALDGVTIVDISIGQTVFTAMFHVMFLADDGTVYASGWNYYGQLGLGNTTSISTPTALTKNNWASILCVGGDYGRTFGIDTSGGLWAWGCNNKGALGVGDTLNKSSPTQVTLPTSCVEVSGCGDDSSSASGHQHYGHTLARLSDGRVYSWGHNVFGQLGLGHTIDKNSPQQIAALRKDNTQVIAWGGVYGSSLVRKTDDTIRTFGCNNYGQLGIGSTTSNNSPQNPGISGHGGIKQIMPIGGNNYSSLIVLFNDGTIMGTGYNGKGRLGVGDNASRSSFAEVPIMKHKPVALCAVGQSSETGLGILTDNGTYFQTGIAGEAQLPEDDNDATSIPYLVQF